VSEEEPKIEETIEEEDQDPADAQGNEEAVGSKDRTVSEGITLEGYSDEDEYAPLMRIIQEQEDQLTAEKDRYLRLLADFDNFKKRVQKEKSEQSEYANEKIIREVLPIIDNLERAWNSSQGQEGSDVSGIVSGLELILSQFHSFLKKYGVEPVESIGQQFDPNVHEAVAQVDVGEGDGGKVVSEEMKGYMINQKLLRPARVVVGRAPGDRNEREEDHGDGDEESNRD